MEKVNSPEDLKKLTVKELGVYAGEVREYILETVKKQGGHLSSNLGSIELTIALHYVFDSPDDKRFLMWAIKLIRIKLLREDGKNLKSFAPTAAYRGFLTCVKASATRLLWGIAARHCHWA